MRSLEMIRDLSNLPEFILPNGYSIISINEYNGYLWIVCNWELWKKEWEV